MKRNSPVCGSVRGLTSRTEESEPASAGAPDMRRECVRLTVVLAAEKLWCGHRIENRLLRGVCSPPAQEGKDQR